MFASAVAAASPRLGVLNDELGRDAATLASPGLKRKSFKEKLDNATKHCKQRAISAKRESINRTQYKNTWI